jgi:hypothetical protein
MPVKHRVRLQGRTIQEAIVIEHAWHELADAASEWRARATRERAMGLAGRYAALKARRSAELCRELTRLFGEPIPRLAPTGK